MSSGSNPQLCISAIARSGVQWWYSIRKMAHIVPVRWMPAKQWTRIGRLAGSFVTSRNVFTLSSAGISPFFDNTLGRGGILSVNAHYNHWELAPANPNPFTQAGLVRDTVLPLNPTTPTQLQNAILFTMGCHGGLNVSDTFPADATKQQQLRDWAQALAQNGAGVYVANTGYGYGDYDAIALSEQLMTMFAHNLASDGTIGRKLMLAKQQFFGTIGTADPYAAKALQEATFYGLPFYAIGSRNEPAPTPLVTPGAGPVTGLSAAPPSARERASRSGYSPRAPFTDSAPANPRPTYD